MSSRKMILSTFEFKVPIYKFMRIRIQLNTMMRILILPFDLMQIWIRNTGLWYRYSTGLLGSLIQFNAYLCSSKLLPRLKKGLP
jgi:hypothetical protein